MRGVKTFLAAVALGTGFIGYQLCSPALQISLPVLGEASIEETYASRAAEFEYLSALDQNDEPVEGVSLHVRYINKDGDESVTTVKTKPDGKIDVPKQDGTYIYSINDVPAGYLLSTSKAILKVSNGKALSTQKLIILKNDGSSRYDAKQNVSNAADEVFGASIDASLPTADDQMGLDNLDFLISTADPYDLEIASKIRELYDSMNATQKSSVSPDTLNAIDELEARTIVLKKDKAKAAGVEARILGLPEVDELGQSSMVQTASDAYNALTDDQKVFVSQEATEKLNRMVSTVEGLRQDKANADNTAALLDAIGEITSLEQASEIHNIRLQYDALSEREKKNVPSESLQRLTGAEATLTKMQAMKDHAVEVSRMIEQLSPAKAPEMKTQIGQARKAFDALSSEEKDLVTKETQTILTSSEEALKIYEENIRIAAQFKSQVESIGEVSDISKREAVESARAAYDQMTQPQQAMISNETYATLQNAETKMAEYVKIYEAEQAKKAAEEAKKKAEEEKKAQQKAAKEAQEAKKKAAEAAKTENSVKPAVLPGDIEGWRPWVIKALKANGLPANEDLIGKVLRQIRTESGGDQNIVQFITDSNSGWILNSYHCERCATAGSKAKNIGHGLMQTIITTFEAYKFEGHNDIFNGYDNLLAAINYAKHAYGESLYYLGEGHGY